MKRVWDIHPGVGGPIAKDRLWFYVLVRSNGAWNFVPGMVYNRNANNPAAWTFDPDPNAPASNENTWKEVQFRLTSQVSQRHKVAVSFDSQNLCERANAISATTAPEAGRERRFPEQPSVQGDWTFPATNRLLIDGGVMYRIEGRAHNPSFVTQPSAYLSGLNPAMISVTELAGTILTDLPLGVDLRRRAELGAVLPRRRRRYHRRPRLQGRLQQRQRIDEDVDVQLSAGELHLPRRRAAVADAVRHALLDHHES